MMPMVYFLTVFILKKCSLNYLIIFMILVFFSILGIIGIFQIRYMRVYNYGLFVTDEIIIDFLTFTGFPPILYIRTFIKLIHYTAMGSKCDKIDEILIIDNINLQEIKEFGIFCETNKLFLYLHYQSIGFELLYMILFGINSFYILVFIDREY